MTDNNQNQNMQAQQGAPQFSANALLDQLARFSGGKANPGADILRNFLAVLDKMLDTLAFPPNAPERNTVKDQLTQALMIDFSMDFFKHIDSKAMESELKGFNLQSPNPEDNKEIMAVFQKYVNDYKANKGQDMWQDFKRLGTKIFVDFINNMGDGIPEDLRNQLFQLVDEYEQMPVKFAMDNAQEGINQE